MSVVRLSLPEYLKLDYGEFGYSDDCEGGEEGWESVKVCFDIKSLSIHPRLATDL